MSGLVHQSVKSAGFRMPAEWEQHECCWMAWPASIPVWGEMLSRTQQGYADVANAIAQFEPVRMLTPPGHDTQASKLCGEGVEIITWDLDDAWMRDIGPNFVTHGSGELAASIFHFNAWGNKYQWFRKDAAAGHRMAEALGIRAFSSPVFLEGGAINTDGEGTLLTTEQCVLNPNRNPDLGREEAEQILCEALGVSRVIWLKGDPEDNETDGHIDGIACFTEPGVVLAEPDPSAPPGSHRRDILEQNIEILRQSQDAKGRRLKVISLDVVTQAENLGDRFCRSFLNFYIANNGIVMPGYGFSEDEEAKSIVKDCFPDREIIQVDCNAIAYGGGSIHCITQQQPVSKR